MRMRYRELDFINNPSQWEVKSSQAVKASPARSGRSAVRGAVKNPCVISGSGKVYSEEGEDWCARMSCYSDDGKSGWLFTPLHTPFEAFLTSFSYKKSSGSEAFIYSFEFTEKCDGRGYEAPLDCTVARSGENAFDIAHRCGISVDRLEELNSFIPPFEISEGECIRIR